MSNDSKKAKKVATKATKVAGGHKVPKYAQDEQAQAPLPAKPASKGNK